MATFMSKLMRRGTLARLALSGVVAFGVAPAALAELEPTTSLPLTASPVDGVWKMTFTPDAATKALGREPIDEIITIDGYGFTGIEMARLGFNPCTPTTGLNLAGCITFTTVLKSDYHGQVTSNGAFNLLNTTMSGTTTWVKDGATYKYTFTGARYTPAPEEYES